MKHHPFTEIWPLLSGKAFTQLKADIKANGLKMPVLVYQDQVLDGRNRQRACEEIGAAVRYVDADVKNDNEALNLVVSLNHHRRHLSVADLAFAAEKLATLRHGSNRFYSQNIDGSRGPSMSETKTLRDAAEAVGSSYGSVKRARAIRTHGTVEDVNDVIAGRVALKSRSEELQNKFTATKRIKPNRNSDDRILHFVNPPPMPSLTPEQVDPEFKGTPSEFTDKYGHVQLMNAEKYATMRFGDWASAVRAAGKRWSELLPNRPVDHNWLRSPRPYDVTKMREALNFLRPMIAEAEALLARAEFVQAPSQPAAGSPPTG